MKAKVVFDIMSAELPFFDGKSCVFDDKEQVFNMNRLICQQIQTLFDNFPH